MYNIISYKLKIYIMKKIKGFTLLELLVVIAIIGLLSTLAVVALGNARMKARDAKRISDLKQVSAALELYYDDNGHYPKIETPATNQTTGACHAGASASNPVFTAYSGAEEVDQAGWIDCDWDRLGEELNSI